MSLQNLSKLWIFSPQSKNGLFRALKWNKSRLYSESIRKNPCNSDKGKWFYFTGDGMKLDWKILCIVYGERHRCYLIYFFEYTTSSNSGSGGLDCKAKLVFVVVWNVYLNMQSIFDVWIMARWKLLLLMAIKSNTIIATEFFRKQDKRDSYGPLLLMIRYVYLLQDTSSPAMKKLTVSHYFLRIKEYVVPLWYLLVPFQPLDH